MSLLGIWLVAQALQVPAQVAAGAPGIYEGAARPDVEVPRIEAESTVDGVLDEPAWAEASRLVGFFQYEPVDGRPAEERTEVLVWYSPEAIHFGIRAYDSQPGTIRATSAERDAIGNEDHVIIYLDTFDDRRRAFFFAANALGAQQDGVRTEGSSGAGRMFGGNTDTNPDFTYDSSGRLTEEGYVVEVRVPFSSLRYPSTALQRWGINVERKVQRTGHTYTWTDARRASASFLGQAGALVGLHDLRRGIVWEAQPVLTVNVPGAREPVTGAFVRGDAEPEAGVNVRVGFPSVSLDATVNPDFSQVETDEGQVTVNERFALFFPEKRPFFLEGIELFATPNQLVYSRRIVDPLGGAKLTGKLGPLGVAHLTAVDEDVDGAGREALFNVTRLRRDFGSSSVAGLVYTDRTVLDGDAFNRVLAADTRIVFGGMYYAEAQAGWSWTRDAGLDASAPIWKAEVDRTGRTWGFNYSLNGVAEEFRTESGFVNRTGIVNARAFNRISLYGEPGAAVERFTVFLGPNRIWRYDDFALNQAIEGGESANFMFTFRGGWDGGFEVERTFVELDPLNYDGLFVNGAPYLPLDGVSGLGVRINAGTPTFQAFDASANASIGRTAIFPEGAEGRQAGIGATLNARPSESLRTTLSATYNRITRTRDGSEFARTIIPRLRAEYQPTRALLFRAVTEYRAERRAALEDARTGEPILLAGEPVAAERLGSLRLDLLASFRPTPGTIAFLGYGTSLSGEDDRFSFDVLERQRDGFFLKLAYQFRR